MEKIRNESADLLNTKWGNAWMETKAGVVEEWIRGDIAWKSDR